MLVRSAPLATVFAVLCVPVAATAQMKMYGESFGKRYISTVTWKEIEASPKWAPEEENPPLSARKVIKLATKVKDSLVKDDRHYRWQLDSAELHHWGGDYWYWVTTYQAYFKGPGAWSGPPILLRLVVLMDGTAVKPDVIRLRPREDDEEATEENPSSK